VRALDAMLRGKEWSLAAVQLAQIRARFRSTQHLARRRRVALDPQTDIVVEAPVGICQ